MIMFAENASMGNIMNRSQDIFLRLRTAFDDAANFQAWLSAQDDPTLEAMGFSPQDLTFLRSAYADALALWAIASDQLPPAGYPQPAGPHDYMVNIKQIIGPV
jgi:hypothetical protein